MALFLISYDLKQKSEADYERVGSKILEISVGNVVRILESVWIVDTPRGIDEIYRIIRGVISDNDRLIVIAVSGPWKAQQLFSDELLKRWLGPAT